MRIAFISDSVRRGGAAVAASRLANALKSLRADVEIRWFVAEEDDGRAGVVSFTEPGRFRGILRDVARRCGGVVCRAEAVHVSVPRNRRNLVRLVSEFEPDVISLHSINQWTKAWMPPSIVTDLCAAAPCVWTLHDLWPLTGDDYPDPYLRIPRDEERAFGEVFAAGTPSYLTASGRRLVLAAPSRWIGRLAGKLVGAAGRVETIPHGVDLAFFRPISKPAAREALDLPQDLPLVMGLAANLADRRKGIPYLLDAMAKVGPKAGLVLTGGRSLGREPAGQVFRLGNISDERLLRLVYSAADVVVVPSLAEQFGLVLIEALACGTPCVGFDVGGIPDIVRPGVTGELARLGDADDLARKIEAVIGLDAAKKRDLSANCRRVAEQDFDVRQQARRYLDVFDELAKGRD